MSAHPVEIRRPIGYLCVAGVLALVSLLLPTGRSAPVPPAAAAPASAAPTTGPAPPPCTGIRDSLRPAGPLPSPNALPAGSTMAAIAARGRLIAGVDQGKYLSGYRDPQTAELRGFEIDMTRSMAAAILGDPSKVQFVVLDVADRVPALQRGEVDVIVNNFSVTCDRQRSIEFSSAYMTASQRLLVPAGSGVREVEDLRGQRVCASRGSTNERVLRDLGLAVDVVTTRSVPDCIVELERGRVAAVTSDDIILAGLAAQDPQTQVVGRALATGPYAVGMRQDAPDLIRFVNALLERGRADGSLAASYRRWLGGTLDPVPLPPPARYRD
jgi:polar amino acid transport system substrate-binding protein